MDAAALVAAVSIALPFVCMTVAIESRLREIELGRIDKYNIKLN